MRSHTGWLLLAVALVTFAAYWPSLGNEFPYDDGPVARSTSPAGRPNPMVAGLRPLGDYFATEYWMGTGATKLYSIRTVVLPTAMPGILTGVILGLSRAAGETAPILFTGVAFYLPFVPTSPTDEFMALPYHLYIMATQHHSIEQVRPIAYGTALVLVALVFILNLGAFFIRARMRAKLESAR